MAGGADQEPLTYNIDQAVQLSGLSRAEIYRALGNRELEARKRGKRTLILADEMKRFLAALPPGRFTAPKKQAA
jgi:hypothetical protein